MKERKQTFERAVTKKWHQPLCTLCREPIENVEDGYAGWYEDDNHQTHSPQLVHGGESGCRYYQRFPNGHLANDYVQDLPVHWFRRAPMEAVCIAMRRRASSEPERLVWHSWLSAILGLPFALTDSIAMMVASDRVSEYVAERVLTVNEASRDIGESVKESPRIRSEVQPPKGKPVRFRLCAIYENDVERELHSGPVPQGVDDDGLYFDLSVAGERWSFYFHRVSGATEQRTPPKGDEGLF